ncbi:MAG: DJ-1 family glyoxalase III [Massiliimalia sp.]
MVYLFLADGFEEIEALTPVDYLRRCKIEVQTVSVKPEKTVTGSHGIPVTADITIDQVDREKIQAVILPGGMPGTLNLEQCEPLQQLIDFCAEQGKLLGAICAAPSILGHKGLLSGKKATCYTGFETALTGAEYTGAPVERDGNMITARGAGVAGQFAFALAEALVGKEAVKALKAGILWEE